MNLSFVTLTLRTELCNPEPVHPTQSTHAPPPQGSTEDDKLARSGLEPGSSPQAHCALTTLLLVQQNGPTLVSWYVNVYSATSCMFSSPLFLRVTWEFQSSGTVSKCKARPSPKSWPQMNPKGKRLGGGGERGRSEQTALSHWVGKWKGWGRIPNHI